jgi:hypothetical protein
VGAERGSGDGRRRASREAAAAGRASGEAAAGRASRAVARARQRTNAAAWASRGRKRGKRFRRGQSRVAYRVLCHVPTSKTHEVFRVPNTKSPRQRSKPDSKFRV